MIVDKKDRLLFMGIRSQIAIEIIKRYPQVGLHGGTAMFI